MMKMHTKWLADDATEVQFENAPQFVHALPPKPNKIEQELAKDAWLVIVFPVVSSRAVECIPRAIEAIKNQKKVIQLGVRPFVDRNETRTWFGEYGSASSPLWIIYKEGKVIHTDHGPLTDEEIADMLKQNLRD